ncbi:hypothetical protein CPC08DRAFT_808581 [Agrocybe pediades]|nr:hypothetical protein CPC08DRAFT_808581 [Agrocybe pediades]
MYSNTDGESKPLSLNEAEAEFRPETVTRYTRSMNGSRLQASRPSTNSFLQCHSTQDLSLRDLTSLYSCAGCWRTRMTNQWPLAVVTAIKQRCTRYLAFRGVRLPTHNVHVNFPRTLYAGMVAVGSRSSYWWRLSILEQDTLGDNQGALKSVPQSW